MSEPSMRERFGDGDRKFLFRHIDDGDQSVYIRTDWLTIILVLGVVFWLGYWWGKP